MEFSVGEAMGDLFAYPPLLSLLLPILFLGHLSRPGKIREMPPWACPSHLAVLGRSLRKSFQLSLEGFLFLK